MSWPPRPRNSVWGTDWISSHFTVVYDACVLYPAPLRDLLMHLALSDLYRARWSDTIDDEWTRAITFQTMGQYRTAMARGIAGECAFSAPNASQP